jgi:glycosyltransferase involved in cell wall biosynthesis
MRVCYISTYPPIENGIATYTRYLSDAIKFLDKEVLIISENGTYGENVFPTYSPLDNDIAAKLFNMVSKMTPDVIHIQHDYNIYGSDNGVQLLDFLYRCKMAGLPTVTTLHTVYEEIDNTQHIILESILSSSSAVILHEQYQLQTVMRYFPQHKKKCHVVPHGVRRIKPVKDAKKILNLEDKKVLLLAGYFTPTKGFHRIVKLFPEIAGNVKDAVLLVSGKMRGIEYGDYQKYFFDLINNSPAFNKIEVLRGQFPQHTFDTILSSADVLALPYEMGGQSGMLAQAAAFQIPVVLSPLKSFESWNKKIKGGIIANSDNEFITAISELLLADDYRKKLKQNIANNIQSYYWDEIAKKHLLVYESVINVPYGKARYFYVPEKQV